MKILKRDERYNDAIKKAWEDINTIEPENVIFKALVEYKNESYLVPLLNEIYSINPIEKKIYLLEEKVLVEGSIGVLILHYLIKAKKIQLANKLITYRELDGGNVYYDAFYNSAIDLITKKFSHDLDLFKKVALQLGGVERNIGETSFEFRFFPRISLTYVLWKGDDEIPGSTNILFDSSIGSQMHTEDIAVIGRTMTFRLLKCC